MLTQAFLLDTGLYSKLNVPEQEVKKFEWQNYRGPPLSTYCKICRLQTTWNQREQLKHVIGGNPQLANIRESILAYSDLVRDNRPNLRLPEMDTTECATYECEACHKSKMHFVLRFELWMDDYRIHRGPVSCTARKVGQWPPPLSETDNQLEEWIGDYKDELRRGLQCERFGFGLGAMAYYRRIVENIVGRMLLEFA